MCWYTEHLLFIKSQKNDLVLHVTCMVWRKLTIIITFMPYNWLLMEIAESRFRASWIVAQPQKSLHHSWRLAINVCSLQYGRTQIACKLRKQGRMHFMRSAEREKVIKALNWCARESQISCFPSTFLLFTLRSVLLDLANNLQAVCVGPYQSICRCLWKSSSKSPWNVQVQFFLFSLAAPL